MFKKLITRHVRMSLEEERHKHRLEIGEMKANIAREKKQWGEDKLRSEKDLKAEHDIKLREAVTLAKLNSEQQIKQAELDASRKFNQLAADLNKEHFDKLSTAMSKLHEDGHVSTRFTRDLALEMMKGLPKNQTETKVITGSVDINK